MAVQFRTLLGQHISETAGGAGVLQTVPEGVDTV